MIRKTILVELVLTVLAMGTMPARAAAKAYIPVDSGVTVIDTAQNAVSVNIPGGQSHAGIAVHPTGAWVYVTNNLDDTVTVYDTGTNSVVAIVAGSRPAGIALDPAGTFAYVANSAHNLVSKIDTSTNASVAFLPVVSGPGAVAVHPSGAFVYVAHSVAGKVSVIDTSTYSVVATVPVGNGAAGIAVHPAGTFVYVTHFTNPGSVSVIDAATNGVVATIETGWGSRGVALNPVGSVLYVANFLGGTVSVIDTSSNTVIKTLPAGSCPQSLEVHPNGASLYVMDFCAANVLVFNTVTGSLITTVSVGANPGGLGRFIVECAGDDKDGDGLRSGCDNCPIAFNPDQADDDQDGKGDACDSDNDNDGCKDAVDEDPFSPVDKVGIWSSPGCTPSSGILYDFAGVDSDSDGWLDCEDPDNDGDGIADASDACPVTPGSDPATCTSTIPCPPQTLSSLCNGGGCEQFFLKLVPVLPDATRELIFEHIRVVGETLYVYPIEDLGLAQSAAMFTRVQGSGGAASAPQACDLVRLEAWAKEQPGSPEHFVMLLAEYDPCRTSIGPMDVGAVLLVTPPQQRGLPLTVEATWTVGVPPSPCLPPSPCVVDADHDLFPDPFDNCEQAANDDQTDADADGAGDVCDCAPDDGSAFAVPQEVTGLTFTTNTAFTWATGVPGAGYGTVHDVLRGSLDELPVGSGRSEWCLATDIGTSAADTILPPEGQGYWYDVRAGNACGEGRYGFASAGTGRESTACP